MNIALADGRVVTYDMQRARPDRRLTIGDGPSARDLPAATQH